MDIEWLALTAGVKPAVRMTIDPAGRSAVEARVQSAGFVSIATPEPIQFPGRPPASILYIAADRSLAEQLVDAERRLLAAEGAGLSDMAVGQLHANLGELLGVPACCREEFAARVQWGVTVRRDRSHAHEDFVAAERAAANSQAFWARLNDLSPDRRQRIVTFYPCRYDCEHAGSYASAVFEVVQSQSPAEAAALRRGLTGRFAIASNGERTAATETSADCLALTFEIF